jgi:hypothetical protein
MPAARVMPEGLLTPETIVVSQESEFAFAFWRWPPIIYTEIIDRAAEQHAAFRDPPALADAGAGPVGRAESLRAAAARPAPRRALAQGGDARQKGGLLPLQG